MAMSFQQATALIANPLLEWCFQFIIAPSSAER